MKRLLTLTALGLVMTAGAATAGGTSAEARGRFATIEDDEAPLHLLVSDYPRRFD